MEMCFFCSRDLNSKTNRILKKKCIQTVAAASIERDDGKHQVLSSVNSLQVHT